MISDSFTTLWIYTILKRSSLDQTYPTGFTTLWIYTILKHVASVLIHLCSFTTLWIYTILKPTSRMLSKTKGFTTLWIYTILKPTRPLRQTLPVLLPYGFTLFSNGFLCLLRILRFYYLMDLHYSQTVRCCKMAIQCFTTLWIYTILKRVSYCHCFYSCFTTLWIYTILKHYKRYKHDTLSFTTLWIYTILKPQISCAHYTAQGKSTRSSTIVLWRNGIVKGAQIPIQHIEFGAHIYAHRRLAL